jgi:hypothetical protein
MVSARADTHAEIVDLFASMAAALSDDNPAGFMKGIDRKMPDYDRLKTQIEALVQSSEVGSSVEPVSDEGDESKRAIDLDWYLELRSRAPGGPSMQRRSVLHCQVEKQGKRWRVVSLKPAAFFDAPKY